MYEENERERISGKLLNQEVQRISDEMKAAMKAVGSGDIPVDILRYVGEMAVVFFVFLQKQNTLRSSVFSLFSLAVEETGHVRLLIL